MPRPRSHLNASLPPYLSRHATGQYRYTHPETGKDYYFGQDRQRAIQAAQKLNALLIRSNSLVDKVVRLEHPFRECVELFEREVIPGKAWKPRTRDEYGVLLRRRRFAS